MGLLPEHRTLRARGTRRLSPPRPHRRANTPRRNDGARHRDRRVSLDHRRTHVSTERGRSVSGGMEFLSALSGPFRRPGAWTKSLGCLELRPHEGGGTRGDNRQPLKSKRADDFDLMRRRSCHAQQSEVKKSGSHVTASSEELLPVRPERANLDLIAATWRRQHDGADCVRVVFRIAADQSDNRPDPF